MPQTGQQTNSIVSNSFRAQSSEPTMFGALDLMNHEIHVILTVDVAFAAISMHGVLLLVLDHCSFGLEVLVACWVRALDFHGGSWGGRSRSVCRDSQF